MWGMQQQPQWQGGLDAWQGDGAWMGACGTGGGACGDSWQMGKGMGKGQAQIGSGAMANNNINTARFDPMVLNLDAETQRLLQTWLSAKDRREFPTADAAREALAQRGLKPETFLAGHGRTAPPPINEELLYEKVTYDEETEKELDAWVQAKRIRDFSTADAIRDKLKVKGVVPDRARPLALQGIFATAPPDSPIFAGKVTKWYPEQNLGVIVIDMKENREWDTKEIYVKRQTLESCGGGPGDLVCFTIKFNESGQAEACQPAMRIAAYGLGMYANKGTFKLPLKQTEKGHGFVECPQMKEYFGGKDIYVNKDLAYRLQPGQVIKFNAYLNATGFPNADLCEPCDAFWEPEKGDLSSPKEVCVQLGKGSTRPPPPRGNPKKWILVGRGIGNAEGDEEWIALMNGTAPTLGTVKPSTHRFGLSANGGKTAEDESFEQAVKVQIDIINRESAFKKLRL